MDLSDLSFSKPTETERTSSRDCGVGERPPETCPWQMTAWTVSSHGAELFVSDAFIIHVISNIISVSRADNASFMSVNMWILAKRFELKPSTSGGGDCPGKESKECFMRWSILNSYAVVCFQTLNRQPYRYLLDCLISCVIESVFPFYEDVRSPVKLCFVEFTTTYKYNVGSVRRDLLKENATSLSFHLNALSTCASECFANM